MKLSDEQVREELRSMAYSSKGFGQVITFVWALPRCFWSDVCKRLIATVIVGVQPDPQSSEGKKTLSINYDPRGCFRVSYDDR